MVEMTTATLEARTDEAVRKKLRSIWDALTMDPYDKLPLDENIAAIEKLKKEHKAVILAHNYQRPEVMMVADYVGDSYNLAAAAKKSRELGNADVIVFCGVNFMAETAYILNPEATVLSPAKESAGCGLADNITAEEVRQWKKENPGIPLAVYINTYADVKAEADVVFTSANAQKVVESLEADEILFAPDKNLYYDVQKKTKKKLLPWEGYCPIHKEIKLEHVEAVIGEHPAAKVIAHPECNPEVTEIADIVLSTTGMMDYVAKDDAKEYIILTERGMLELLQSKYPEKKFHLAYNHKSCDESCACPFMKSTTIGKVRRALEEYLKKPEKYVIKVPEETRLKALTAVERMIAIGRQN